MHNVIYIIHKLSVIVHVKNQGFIIIIWLENVGTNPDQLIDTWIGSRIKPLVQQLLLVIRAIN